jgi:predicted nucleic acid-binding protein
MQERKLSIYLDTSVINFLYADDSPDYKNVTIDFFDHYLHDYHVYISEIVHTEVANTQDRKKKVNLQSAIKKYKLAVYDSLNNEIEQLASAYINKNIIPRNKVFDSFHIAFATFYEFDILLSWNFKHLANIKKQMKVNALNEMLGYTKELKLLNPMEVIYEK